MCGRPLKSIIGDKKTEYARLEGFSLNYAHYPSGFQGYAERLRFSREVCDACARDIRELMGPLIRLVHDKETGR